MRETLEAPNHLAVPDGEVEKFVLLLTQDAMTGLVASVLICALASTLAIRAALKIDPAEAIG